MSLFFNRILVVSLLTSAITFAAGNGLGEHASFHLPVEAHWGTAVLQPGDYKMVTPDFGQEAFVIRGPEGGVFVLPQVTDTNTVSDACYLKLQEVNGSYFIIEYLAGPAGKTYSFRAPKEARHQSFADGHGRLVAVTTSSMR